MVINKKCPVCNKTTSMTITVADYNAYEKYEYYGGSIRDYNDKMSKDKVDFLETGICSECFLKHKI